MSTVTTIEHNIPNEVSCSYRKCRDYKMTENVLLSIPKNFVALLATALSQPECKEGFKDELVYIPT